MLDSVQSVAKISSQATPPTDPRLSTASNAISRRWDNIVNMISFNHFLVILSLPISILGAYAYIRDTVRGKTKPNRVSWFLWALAPLLGTVVAISADADWWATSRTFMAGFIPLVVVIASFVNPQSYWKLTFFDVLCGAFSLVAIVLWLIVDSPSLAILFLVIGDGCACIPTLRKAWTNPETETGLPYLAGLIATLFVIPSIPVWDIKNSAFQIYQLIANTSLAFIVYRKRIFT